MVAHLKVLHMLKETCRQAENVEQRQLGYPVQKDMEETERQQQAGGERERQIGRKTDREKKRQSERKTDREKKRQSERER